jgi:Domain of unknown function (DUF4926)
MTISEHERVILTTDLPQHRLATGDVGTVVHVYEDAAAFEVEFIALDGATIAIVTVDKQQVRKILAREITHARQVA